MVTWKFYSRNEIEEFQKFFNPKKKLSVEIHHYIDKKRLFTKLNEPKVFDVDNRIKILIDGLSKILEFDDKWIFKVSAEKRASPTGAESSEVIFSEHSS